MRRHHGFTLVELLVVVSVIALLIALLLPALKSAREAARSVACQSNLRQVGVLFHLYSDDFENYLPAARWGDPSGGNMEWQNQTHAYLGSGGRSKVYICPTEPAEAREGVNYMYSGRYGHSGRWNNGNDPTYRLRHRDDFKNPSKNLALMDGTNRSLVEIYGKSPKHFVFTDGASKAQSLTARHSQKFNVMWVDGHITTAEWPDITSNALKGSN